MPTDPALPWPAEPLAPSRPDQAPTRTGARPHPARAVATRLLAAYVVMSVLLVLLGEAISSGSATAGIRHWDVSVNRWFAGHRSGPINTLSDIGSHLGNTETVVAAGVVVVAVLWFRRHDVVAAVGFAGGLVVEVTVFLTTTLLVDRSRPPVHKLDAAPPTSSFPSGHTAAAVALYAGLAVVIVWGVRSGRLGRAVAALLVLVPVAVGLSRLSRGMHHPTDVLAGAALGVACILVSTRIARSCLGTGEPEPTSHLEIAR